MKVLVTGGSGFLGGYIVCELRHRDHVVVGLARSEAAADKLRTLGADPVCGDLDDPHALEAAFRASEAEALLNVASLGFGHARTIVGAAEAARLNRAVFISTTAIFTTLNARSKAVRVAAESTIAQSNLSWTIVRPTMIYGDPGDRNIARLLLALRRLPVLPIPGGGSRLQQPVHAADVASAAVLALERDVAIRTAYDVAGPDALTLREIVRQASRAVGRSPMVVPVPLAPAILGARLYERVSTSPRIRSEQLERLDEDKVFDIQAARQDLDYAPRSFAVGVAQEAAQLP